MVKPNNPKRKRKHKRSKRSRRPKAGSRPGELVLAESVVPVTARVFDYGPDSYREWEPKLSELGKPPPEVPVRWIDIHGLSDKAVLEALGCGFAIHPLALADIVNVGQRAKVDAYEHNHVIIIHMVRLLENNGTDFEQVSIVIGDRFVLTVQECNDEHDGDVFEPLRNRIREKLGLVRTMGADYLVYVLLDAVVDAYFPVADRIGASFEELEREIIESGGDRNDLNRIHELRGELRDFERPVRQMQALLTTLLQGAQTPISEGVRVWLRDVYDHVLQVREQLDRMRESATALMELHLSTANNKMNEVMKLLTVMASVFIPLTFMASIYGMNFDYMPELRWKWGYPAVIVLMASVGTGLFVMFRRRNWL
ncbi:MAG TPA: magnesium/cobalt transporter CorA [Enhygromyxa sp.]|nr:magnesium/cobalt transporter CorA [Enhygromyxa sp.]